MNARFASVAAVLCETAFVACLASFGSTGTENTGAAPIAEPRPPSLTADAPRATAIGNAAVGNAAVDNADMATVAKSVTTTDTTVASDESKSVVEAALTDSSQILPPDSPTAQVATASTSDPVPNDVKEAVGSIEILDECLVADICVDRYLWALYQRTPKEDSIKVQERRKVTVKRKHKTVTVTKSFTRLVDEDFTWKDPKAAEKAAARSAMTTVNRSQAA